MQRFEFDPCDPEARPSIIDQIEVHVLARLGTRLSQFRLIVQDEGLVLRGRARTWHVKQLVQEAVMEATPVPIVANEIEVS